MDALDIKILKLLRNNARMSAKAIAEELYISAPTVATRIEAMKNNQVIKGFVTEINQEVFGNIIHAYIEMEVSPTNRSELYSLLETYPEVLRCSRITGEYSLILEVAFHSTDAMDRFTMKLQHYGRTRTQIVFSTVIDRRELPLPEEEQK